MMQGPTHSGFEVTAHLKNAPLRITWLSPRAICYFLLQSASSFPSPLLHAIRQELGPPSARPAAYIDFFDHESGTWPLKHKKGSEELANMAQAVVGNSTEAS